MIKWQGEKLYTYIEASEMIGVSPITLRNTVFNEKLDVVRIGSAVFIPEREIDRYKTDIKGQRGKYAR
jgi:hypothetical protein